MDDADIICAYTMSDDVCNRIISWLMGQLVEKEELIGQN
jgi:hypothetical protein